MLVKRVVSQSTYIIINNNLKLLQALDNAVNFKDSQHIAVMGDFNYPAIEFESNTVDSGVGCSQIFHEDARSVFGAKCHRDYRSKGRSSKLTPGLYNNG